jgi:hypothetical protein
MLRAGSEATAVKAMRAALGAALACAALLATPRPARAALGDGVASVASDQARAQGTLQTRELQDYSLHEIRGATGTVIREFSSPDGSVFAVAWEGPFMPDVRRLLGRSWDAYVSALRTKRRGHGPLVVRLPDLVVESAGHPRGFHGRAFLPQLVPATVSLEAIR